MDTYVVIPEEFSLVLTLHPNPKNVLEMNVALWSNQTLSTGSRFYPDQGTVKLDKLEVYTKLCDDDVSILIFIIANNLSRLLYYFYHY